MAKYPWLILFTALMLTACGGGSSSGSGDDSASRSQQSATSDTPDNPAEDADDPIVGDETDSPEPPAGAYMRPLDYRYMVTLPLQFLPTADGRWVGVRVTLPANERRKPADGPFPTILVQTAYNMHLIGAVPMTGGALLGAPDPFMVKRGYAVVAVDTLGTGVSQGGWEMLGDDEQKAYGDAVDWVKQQPWFNGKLGVAGASYMAISALFTAQRRPDDVQAIFASVPMGDAQRGTVGTGGMINGVFMSHWLTLTQVTTQQNFLAVLQAMNHANLITAATREHNEQIDNYYLPIIEKALNGDPEVTYDSPFWRTRSPIENIDKIKAPTLIFGALNDIFQRDEPLLYEKLKQNNVDARLMIYNGDHVGHFVQGFLGVNKLGPMPFLLLQWFDHHLMGIDSGVEAIPPVTQYVKNNADHLLNGFSTTTDWPHPEAAPERWYLHGDMSLTQDAPIEEEPVNTMEVAPFATIEYGKSEDGSLLIFNVEPNDGTKCSASYHQWTLGIAGVASFNKCYRDNRELEADALNYETALMEEDYYINGPLQADIWISTTAHEAVLSVRVDEVTANGRTVQPLTNGLLLASARRVDESRSRFMNGEMIQPYHYLTEDAVEPVVPGEVFKMQVEIFPTSAIIRKGHKLRVSIAPSNDAQGMLNLPRQELAKDGVTSIHNSPDYPSSIVLPIVPLSALN